MKQWMGDYPNVHCCHQRHLKTNLWIQSRVVSNLRLYNLVFAAFGLEAALISKGKNWLFWSQENMSRWSYMTHLYNVVQFNREFKADIIIILTLNNNQSLTNPFEIQMQHLMKIYALHINCKRAQTVEETLTFTSW